MIVMKFGGTSVESAEAIERVIGIVKCRLDRKPVVVVSAMGKTTNRLLKIARLAIGGKRDEALNELLALRDYHLRESNMERTVDEHFQELTELVKGLAVLGELSPRAVDAISSFGERLSSLIVTNFFKHHGVNAVHLDSRKVIVTDHRHTQAAPLLEKTYAKLAAAVPPLAAHHVVVMGGFIGSTDDGVVTTLGRGGSDFTASIVGAGIGAEEIQIWTDVDGMLTADPTILLYRSRRTGLFRRQSSAPRHRHARHRSQYPGHDPQFPPPAGGRNAHPIAIGAVEERRQIDRLQG
jgi:aspartate kinase